MLYYEKNLSTAQVTKYYYFGSQRVAMRKDNVVQYLLGDHLGSTSLVLDANGARVAESRYYPYGETRWTWPEDGTLPTDYRFTGARQEAGLGIYIMGARWYDPALARWLSADTLVPEPGNPQAFNRYSYVLGNPLRFKDPTGHFEQDELQEVTGLDDEAFAEWWASLPEELQNMLLDAQWGSILSFDEPILGDTVHFELLFAKDRQTDKIAFFNLVSGKKMNFWEGISHSRTALEETGVRADLIGWDSARHPLHQHAGNFQGDGVFVAFDDEWYRGYVQTLECAVGVCIGIGGWLLTGGEITAVSIGSTAAGVAWEFLTCDLSGSSNPVPYIWNGQIEQWQSFPDLIDTRRWQPEFY